jgi:hypothetical protein
MASMKTILLAVLVAALIAACGGAASRSASTSATGPTGSTSTSAPASTGSATTSTPATTRGTSSPAAFAWLHPAPTPPGWSAARLSDAAVLVYPRSWHRIHSDPGTISAVLTDAADLIRRYVNATPQQGE